MHPLERKIRDVILQELISDNEHVFVLGVSGGPDSVALLHIMYSLQSEMGISIVAVYVNHGLRPAEAIKEEELVRSLCDNLGVAFETASVDVCNYAEQENKSLEHAARVLRYKVLREYKEKYHATLIAVAHTADDQAEEILIRLLRGSGRKGLSGMSVRSGDIIRPLLFVEKETLLNYLSEKHIAYAEDSSNADMRFLRNRVRHQLIPYLEKEFDEGIRHALLKSADSLTEDEEFLDELAKESLEEVILNDDNGTKDLSRLTFDRHQFVLLPSSLQRRVIEKILWKVGCRAKYDYIINVVEAAQHGATDTEIHLSRGLRVGIQRDYLEFVYPKGQTSWRGKLYGSK